MLRTNIRLKLIQKELEESLVASPLVHIQQQTNSVMKRVSKRLAVAQLISEGATNTPRLLSGRGIKPEVLHAAKRRLVKRVMPSDTGLTTDQKMAMFDDDDDTLTELYERIILAVDGYVPAGQIPKRQKAEEIRDILTGPMGDTGTLGLDVLFPQGFHTIARDVTDWGSDYASPPQDNGPTAGLEPQETAGLQPQETEEVQPQAMCVFHPEAPAPDLPAIEQLGHLQLDSEGVGDKRTHQQAKNAFFRLLARIAPRLGDPWHQSQHTLLARYHRALPAIVADVMSRKAHPDHAQVAEDDSEEWLIQNLSNGKLDELFPDLSSMSTHIKEMGRLQWSTEGIRSHPDPDPQEARAAFFRILKRIAPNIAIPDRLDAISEERVLVDYKRSLRAIVNKVMSQDRPSWIQIPNSQLESWLVDALSDGGLNRMFPKRPRR
jgi:hypothetical protein